MVGSAVAAKVGSAVAAGVGAGAEPSRREPAGTSARERGGVTRRCVERVEGAGDTGRSRQTWKTARGGRGRASGRRPSSLVAKAGRKVL